MNSFAIEMGYNATSSQYKLIESKLNNTLHQFFKGYTAELNKSILMERTGSG